MTTPTPGPLQYSPAKFEVAREKALRAPAMLTDDDIEQLAIVDPILAGKAGAARSQAAADALKPKIVTTAAVPPAALRLTLDMAKQLCSFTEPKDGQPGTLHTAGNWDALIAQFGTVPVPLVVLDAVLKYVLGGVAKRNALEARIAVLEARGPGLKYCGVWMDGETHGKDVLVTRSGALWISERDTVLQPGSPDSGWKMITKRGSLND